ncbi:MAG: hypothetical protein HQK83_13080 [Fibrobacteria bacterium]|nr:hypothetical protein [Fibrobacteria bacterium]
MDNEAKKTEEDIQETTAPEQTASIDAEAKESEAETAVAAEPEAEATEPDVTEEQSAQAEATTEVSVEETVAKEEESNISEEPEPVAEEEDIKEETTEQPEAKGEPEMGAAAIAATDENIAALDAELEETNEAVEQVDETEEQPSLCGSVKKAFMICPKLLVHVQICNWPKKAAEKAKALVANSASSIVKLPKLRKQIKRTFSDVGSRVYELHLNGESNIIADDEIKSAIDQVKSYEGEIEAIETRMIHPEKQTA